MDIKFTKGQFWLPCYLRSCGSFYEDKVFLQCPLPASPGYWWTRVLGTTWFLPLSQLHTQFAPCSVAPQQKGTVGTPSTNMPPHFKNLQKCKTFLFCLTSAKCPRHSTWDSCSVLGAFPASLSGLLLQACASVSPWHPMCVGSAGVCGQWGVWAAVCSQTEAAAPWLGNKSAWQGQECKHRRSQGTSEAVIRGVSRSAVGMGGERGAEGGGEERGELAGLFEYQALPHSRLRWQLHYLHI